MKGKQFIGKNIFLVGGSEGIGLESAKLLAEKGSNILIFSRNKEKLEKAENEIRNACTSDSQNVSHKQMDITDNRKVEEIMATACEEFGVPDILINCAGIAVPRNFEEIDYDQFDRSMKINVYGIRNTVAAIYPRMKKNGGGLIVNTASMLSFAGIFGYTDYCASKFGALGFSEALRFEARWHNIDIKVLCPADTDTPGYRVENQTKPLETQVISESAKIRTPRYVAELLVKKMFGKKFLIIVGADSLLLMKMKHFFPRVVDAFQNWAIKKARKMRKSGKA
ncbi:MAG: SDR family oxidoreductase [bacterium]|nr:SDR family oxidoreductase [bacterium]